MGGQFKNIYSGRFSIDKLILYHQKEERMGSLAHEDGRSLFHAYAVDLLKELKELQNVKN